MLLWGILLSLKMISGLIVGLTTAIIVQTLTGAGVFSLVFVTVAGLCAFLKLVWHYKWMGLMVVNLFFISLFLILKLYVSAAAS